MPVLPQCYMLVKIQLKSFSLKQVTNDEKWRMNKTAYANTYKFKEKEEKMKNS